MIKSAFLALSFLALMAAPASAKIMPAPVVQAWTVDPAASSIEFSGQHTGNDFKGSFKSWTAQIAFDPADLKNSAVAVTIQTSSALTENQTYDGSLPSAEWLNFKAFPEATFQSKEITHLDGDKYEAKGTLTIKNISTDVTLPFTLKIDGETATMTGTLVVDRLAYDIGKAADPKGDWVSKDIAVAVSVKATKASIAP